MLILGVGVVLTVAGVVMLFSGADGGGVLTTIGVCWLLALFGLAALSDRGSTRRKAEADLFETGRPATAVVERVRLTGLIVNDTNQRIELTLRIEPAEDPPFSHQRKLFVPLHGVPRTGDRIKAAYDPADHTRVALQSDPTWDSGGTLLITRSSPD
jgi:hypothetical protein